jgi:cytochrome c
MNKRIAGIAVVTMAVLMGGSTLLYAQSTPPLRSAWSGIYTAAQADKGKALFGDNCAKCHGGTLDGNDEIPALKGPHFMADWESQTVAELIQRVHGTMPMDNPGKLNTESSTAVVAYLLQQNGMPSGATPITDGSAAQSRIDAVRPANIPAPAATAAPAKPVVQAKAVVKPALKAKAKAKTN